MTELEAVNIMLATIGEAPIEGFADDSLNEITDAALARRTLSEVDLDVQSEGWHWNKSFNLPLSKNTEGEYILPSNALRVEFSSWSDPENRYVQRGNRLFDVLESSYAIKADSLKADQVIWRLPWEEVPHPAQQYIVTRAARINSNRFTNSNVILGYTSQDEAYARAMLIRDEESRAHNNMLWGNSRGMGMNPGFLPREGLRGRRL